MALFFAIRWLSILGLVISLYALYVIRTLKKYPKYQPICDVRENISCSKAFTSKYGKLAVWPNPVYGLLYYFLMFMLTLYYQSTLIMILSSIAFFFSLCLACISYIKQKNFCLVCSSIYLINILIFAFSL